MGNGKRFALYLLFTIAALVLLFWGAKYQVELKIFGTKNFNHLPYYFFSALFPILFGLALAIPNLFQEFHKIGKWEIDWVKLLAIGVPALLLNLSLVLMVTTPMEFIDYLAPLYPLFFEVMIMDNIIITFSGTIFGYMLISSLSKEVMNKTD